MDVQDVLLKHNWNKEAAVEDLKARPPKPVKRTYYQATAPSTQNGNHVKKARRESDDGGDSDGAEYNKHNVFDSDDSENEGYTQEMTIQRKEVYDFFNSANVGELTSIKSCSMKKAEIIIENRPYRNWEELVGKFQEKPLQTELLNNCQEYLDKRNSLKKLMKKCKAIVLKLEKAVSDGAGITEQPYTLNEGLQLSNYQLVS
jgi:SWI/SNF-related matrix-associated actin-dependent regulator 1 of chromatin subfamily A